MKRIIALALILTSVFALCACGGAAPAAAPTPAAEAAPAPVSSMPVNGPFADELMPQQLASTKKNSGFNWNKVIDFPSAEEIAEHNRTSTSRAPYVGGWMKIGGKVRYGAYAVDFKADYLPDYTYCCLANFYLDFSSVESQYVRVYTDAIGGYAGFQHRGPGESPVSLMSFWEIKCEDQYGNVTKILPTRVYPEPDNDMTFGGEGEGVHCFREYNWMPGKWYRMLLLCGTSETTGNTTIEQWVQDLETNSWTYLCKYDLGVKNVAFIGDICVFLENYDPQTSGDVRTLEVKNVRYQPEYKSKWVSVRSGYFEQSFDWTGSYRYGTNKDTFWMITTGVTNKAGKPAGRKTLKVSGGASNSPF